MVLQEQEARRQRYDLTLAGLRPTLVLRSQLLVGRLKLARGTDDLYQLRHLVMHLRENGKVKFKGGFKGLIKQMT